MKKYIPLILLLLFVVLFFHGVFWTQMTYFQRDTLIQFQPWMGFLREELTKGNIPVPHLWTKTHHIGITGCILFLLGMFVFRDKLKWFIFSAGIFFILLSMGSHLPVFYGALYKVFPPVRMIRHHGTAMFVTVFCMSIISAAGHSSIKKTTVALILPFIIFTELYFYGRDLNPVLHKSIFDSKAENISFLTENRGLHRFAITPLTYRETTTRGGNLFHSFVLYRDKLFGNVNITHKLYNFYGQELNLTGYFAYADKTFSKPSLDAAAKLLGMANVKYVLSAAKVSAKNFRLPVPQKDKRVKLLF